MFGAGPSDADLMLVGERPGDQEDRQGAPFVGPAGGVLDDAMRDAGIARDRAYVTNVVKHFKFTRRGTRRIHDKPNREEVVACMPWLEGEIAAVRPDVVVLMGDRGAGAARVVVPGDRAARRGLRTRRQPAHGHRAPVVDPARAARPPASRLRRLRRRPDERGHHAAVTSRVHRQAMG